MSISRITQLAARVAWAIPIILSATWGAFALWFQVPGGPTAAGMAAAVWVGLAAAAVIEPWRRLPGTRGSRRWRIAYGLAFVALMIGWQAIRPSDDRDWAPDVARHLDGRIEGSKATLGNVRDFDWRSDDDFTERWQTRTYDLDKLRTVDAAMSYWMGPAIAHTLVSFGFDDGRGGTEYVTFSIEIRKERGEQFSAIAGFFKRYELSLVAADERDILRVRTNVRGEDVYLYRIRMPRDAMRSLFIAYVEQAGDLRRRPRFYDTLFANCTTIVYQMASRIVGGLPLDWRLLASGYLPEYLFDVGALVSGVDLPTLRARGRITDRAKAADRAPDFSERIRDGMPGAKGRN